MPILVEPDSTTAGVLAPALPAGSQVLTRPDDVDSAMTGGRDYAVVLGPTLEVPAATALAERVRAAHPATTIILLRHELAPDIYASSMAAGIGAVVPADDQQALGTALNRAKHSWDSIVGPVASDEGQHKGEVLTVFSPKGGVGKTTMSVNLGIALAQRGHKVCVVDLDLSFGDVAITLQLVPQHTIADAAGSEEHLDYSMLQTLLTPFDERLSILAAPTQPEGRDRISPSLVRGVIDTLRRHFDYIVIDTPPGFDDQVLGAFDETDECIVVATLDVPTLKNTKVALETLDLLHLVRQTRHLVLNRADDEVGLSQENVEGILNMLVSVSLPSATAVASATNHGQPIVLSKPDHPVSKGIIALADQLIGSSTTSVNGTAKAKRGLFGRKKR
ncbi:MAG: P-loop NTPase [Marmoricola sp.]|nr:P-loop NTPase [Marmoricola sp.]